MALDYSRSLRRSLARTRESFDRRKDDGEGASFFLWAILIMLLLAMNAGVWTFSLLVFGYPERPFNYRLLTKLEKLEPIKRFPALDVPTGKFYSPQKLYEAFYAHNPDHLKAVNARLLRDYVKNYRESDDLIYVRGTFRIYQVRELTENDLFPSGVVLRAIYQEYPQVVIELILPAATLPAEHFKMGDDIAIDVEGSSSFATLLHVEKLRDYKICFTILPLVYGSYPFSETNKLTLSPPSILNMDASLPITDEAIGELPATAIAAP